MDNPFNSEVVREGVELAEEAVDTREAEQEMLDRQAMADEENPPKDPNVKDPSEFGAKENFQEVGDVIGGIGKDLIADTAFLPQSLFNLATGRKMDKSEYWDPLIPVNGRTLQRLKPNGVTSCVQQVVCLSQSVGVVKWLVVANYYKPVCVLFNPVSLGNLVV